MSDIERGIMMVVLVLVYVLLIRIAWNVITRRIAERKKETLLGRPRGPELLVRLWHLLVEMKQVAGRFFLITRLMARCFLLTCRIAWNRATLRILKWRIERSQKPTNGESKMMLFLGDMKALSKNYSGDFLFLAIVAVFWFFFVVKIWATEPFVLGVALIIIGLFSFVFFSLIAAIFCPLIKNYRHFLRRRVRERAGFPLSPWGMTDHPEIRTGEIWLANGYDVRWKSARVGDIPYDINARPLTEEERKYILPIFVQLSEVEKAGISPRPFSFFRT